MPNFKTHVGFGSILAVAMAAVAVSYSFIAADFMVAAIFFAIIVGTVMPDLDSDKGTPFKIAINILALSYASSAFAKMAADDPKNIWLLIIIPIAAYFFVLIIIGWVIKKFTHHRGIIHSVPAAALSFFLALIALSNFPLEEKEKLFLALAVGVGFLGHLFLDELDSLISWKGILPKAEQSLGSAMKLWSRSSLASLAAYAALAYFVYLNFSFLSANLRRLFS